MLRLVVAERHVVDLSLVRHDACWCLWVYASVEEEDDLVLEVVLLCGFNWSWYLVVLVRCWLMMDTSYRSPEDSLFILQTPRPRGSTPPLSFEGLHAPPSSTSAK